MKQRLLLLARLAAFFIVFFWVARLYFLGFLWDEALKMGVGDFFGSFIHGLRLDVSMSGYLLLLFSLIISLSYFIPKTLFRYLITIPSYLFVSLFSLVVVADAELYRHWGSRIDTSVFNFLKTPAEAMASVPLWQTGVFLMVMVIMAGLFIYGFRKTVLPALNTIQPARRVYSIGFIVIAAFMILPIRGSVGIAPVNTGMVYFSKNIFSNHAAINGLWNFFYDWFNSDRTNIDVKFMGDNDAENVRQSMVSQSDSLIRVLNQPRPNVLVIVLESFSAKAVEVLGGQPGVTPQLNKLWNEGVAFNHIYATGTRSDRGLVAILSGFPSHPLASSMKYPKKTQKMPSICHSLAPLGYQQATYYYGGDTDFANMRSYMMNAGFQKIVNVDEFPRSQRNSKWGVHDEFMFKRLMSDIDSAQLPFLKVMFTLSSHEPFDVPMATRIKGNRMSDKFFNSIYYADSCMGQFIREAKTKQWWKNTLVVMIADHSIRYPEDIAINVPERYTIPMLWTGGAVDTVMQVNAYGNQTDMVATLLGQLNVGHHDYRFSNNLLDPARNDYAMYIFNKGFGVITPKGQVVYDLNVNSYTSFSGDTTALRHQAEGLFQSAITYFNKL
jgi:phosphoglycerol transferase MdoB-like AlkP superfamily enzyme